jgi:hypothetical protein
MGFIPLSGGHRALVAVGFVAHSLISFRNSLFLVSFVSVASCRSSSAIRPAAKSGRPDFFGFSNRIVMGVEAVTQAILIGETLQPPIALVTAASP